MAKLVSAFLELSVMNMAKKLILEINVYFVSLYKLYIFAYCQQFM
jgi:hypothetical protein